MHNGQKPNTAGFKWEDKTLLADDTWAQVAQILAENNIAELPQTPRRPDVRMIIKNISGSDVTFKNPGDHSGSKPETIPGAGEKNAAMVMVKGETLEQQSANAAKLEQMFNLSTEGLSPAFIAAMDSGELNDLIDEAYGPAPYDDQASRLDIIDWKSASGQEVEIEPSFGPACSYGARPATNETVFLTKVPIFVQGTGTTPELLEADGMCIAVSKHWQTGAISTRPIVPSVARTYYGAHYDSMPIVTEHPDFGVQKVDLNNGQAPLFNKDLGQSGVSAAKPKVPTI